MGPSCVPLSEDLTGSAGVIAAAPGSPEMLPPLSSAVAPVDLKTQYLQNPATASKDTEH